MIMNTRAKYISSFILASDTAFQVLRVITNAIV